LSNSAPLAAGTSRALKDASIIATGNVSTGDVRLPPHLSILPAPQKA
jgi:hypothetical protein